MKRKKRGSSRFYILYLLILIVIITIFIGLRYLARRIDIFQVDEIIIVGNYNLQTSFLRSFSKEFLTENLFSIPKEIVKNKYKNIIRIKDVEIRRQIPNKLKIIIDERKAVFLIRSVNGELFPIDAEKIVLDNDNFYQKEILPIIDTEINKADIVFGENISNQFVDEVFSFKKEIRQTGSDLIQNISEFYINDGIMYLVEIDKGYKIIFGKGDIPAKIRKYEIIQKSRTFDSNSIVDLRFDDQLVIRPED